jgi:nucleoside-diphosphate-sugar epimerase
VIERGRAPLERRIIVTGGAGYLGSTLTRSLLARGYRVCVLDAQLFGGSGVNDLAGEERLEIIRGDTRSIADLSRAFRGAAAVIHLAAIVGDAACQVDPDVTWTTNLQATKLVLEACRHYAIPRLLFASTCSVYGASDDLLLNEGSILQPVSLYAQTRIESELIILGANSSELTTSCLRMATLYGQSARMRYDLVVNIMAARAVRERLVTVFGGDQWRPLVHVADAAEAFVLALEAPADIVGGEVFNVGSNEQNFRIKELAERIARVFEVPVETRAPSADDLRNYRVAFDKVAHHLGFGTRRSVEDACREIQDVLVRHPEIDHRDERYLNHRFPYAIDPAILPSHRPRLHAVDDFPTEAVRRKPSP